MPLSNTTGLSIGIDFGTTNSSIALALPDGTVELVRFPTASGITESFRSVLYLEQHREAGRSRASPGLRASNTTSTQSIRGG
jgi:hypothetical chaperone protein